MTGDRGFDETADSVRRIVAEVLEVDRAAVADDLRQEQVESWDSLRHLMLVSALEEGLGLRFAMADVGQMTSLREILRRVCSRV